MSIMENPTKRICPTCGYEYESWVEVCPDCGTPIESRPRLEVVKGGIDPNADPQWTVVTNVPNAIIGNLIKSQLEDAGIPVLMLRSSSADIAYFSHNDYVPHDLRVPRHLVREARRLIDSAPGDDYGPRPWPGVFDEDEEDVAEGGENQYTFRNGDGSTRDLPEGWTMLPTESDIKARQEVRRTHGEALRGWYWSDHTGPGDSDAQSGYGEDGDEEYEYEDNPSYSGEGWYKPSRWVMIFYGILITAISLPFIFQLLEQLWRIFSFDRP
jgi:hypothetical protein